MGFVKATKAQAKLRLALIGPSGSGKTYTALAVATALGKRVAVIDTERGSASKYAGAGLFEFDTANDMKSFAPAEYVRCIREAEAAGYDVVVIDSLSHAWNGKGGALEMKDTAAARSSKGNSFDAWREVTPAHNTMVDAIVGSRCHVIVTMRTKTEYVVEQNERGKNAPRKVGLAPIQRDGMEYEFDVTMDMENARGFVAKTRCPELSERSTWEKPGKEFAEVLSRWLSDGAPAPARQPEASQPQQTAPTTRLGDKYGASAPAQPRTPIGDDQLIALTELLEATQDIRLVELLSGTGVATLAELSAEQGVHRAAVLRLIRAAQDHAPVGEWKAWLRNLLTGMFGPKCFSALGLSLDQLQRAVDEIAKPTEAQPVGEPAAA